MACALAVPAAALMLGAADGASTVGLNFQSWYYDSGATPQTVGYGFGYQTTGAPVTAKAFGVDVADWTNSDPLPCNIAGFSATVPFGGTLSADIVASNMWGSGLLSQGVAAPWLPGNEIVPQITPGNYQVSWSYIDNLGWSLSLSGLNDKFPGGYVVELIGNKVTSTSEVNINENTGSTSVGTISFSQLPDGLGIGSSPTLTNDSITLVNDSRNVSNKNCAVAGLVITDKPVINFDPTGGMLITGSTLDISVAAVGIAPLAYQWKLNGTDIAGATAPTYSKANVVAGDSGTYTVVVSNGAGTVVSSPAVVTVASPPTLVWAGPGNWDINTTTNWLSDGNPAKYTEPAYVEFDNTAATTTVNIPAAVQPLSVSFFGDSTYTLAGEAITGGATLSTSGVGVVNILNNIATTGAISLQGWAVNVGNGGTAGTLGSAGSIVLGDGAVLTFNRSDTITFPATRTISGNGSLVYSGSGTLNLGDANTFTGGLTVNSGTVILSGGGWYNNSPQGTGTAVVNAGATLVNQNPHSFGAGDGSQRNLVLNGGTFSLNRETFINDVAMTAGTINRISGGTGDLRTDYTVNGGSVFTVNPAGTSSVISAPVSLVGNATFAVADGAAGVDLLDSGTLAGGGGVIKSGDGTLVFSGANTYTGDTTVNAGTLVLADDAQLKFVITAGGVNNRIKGTGTVQLDGDFVLDLTAAGSTAGDSWTLVDAGSLTETFGPTFSLVGFTHTGGTLWTTPAYRFDTATGILSVAPATSPYQTWAASYGLDPAAAGAPDADPDGDGLDNAVEFVIGAAPNAATPAADRPTTTMVGGQLVIHFKRTDASESAAVSVVYGTNLQDWPGEILVPAAAVTGPPVTVVDNGATVADDVTVTIPASGGAKQFARLKVTVN